MICLIISIGTLFCGIYYLLASYNVLVGWMQVFLGCLCICLIVLWKRTEQLEKAHNKKHDE